MANTALRAPSLARLLAAAATLTLAVTAAPPGTAAEDTAAAAEHTPAPAPAGETDPAPVWSYSGDHGPEHWGDIPGAAICATGRQQSPIDLGEATPGDVADPVFGYRAAAATRLNTSHGVVIGFAGGSAGALVLDGVHFDLVQLHLHTPSEHRVAGRAFAAELHLVHRDAMGELAVVGVLLVPGEENEALVAALPPWPAPAVEEPLAVPVDPAAFLPADRDFYRYEGSLTTPPCREGVRWVVLQEPVTAAPAQLALLAEALHANSRPVQPRHERAVEAGDGG